MSRFLLVIVCLTLASPAAMALDPEVARPYHLRVVVRMAENRVFTPLFKDQVKRGLQASLQAALGNLGQVEVVTRVALRKELEATDPPPSSERRQSLQR